MMRSPFRLRCSRALAYGTHLIATSPRPKGAERDLPGTVVDHMGHTYQRHLVPLAWLLLSIIMGMALVVRLWVLWTLRFDGLYGQDAFAYYYYGVALWRDHSLSYPWPWLAQPLRLYWPLGEPTLVAVATAIAGGPSALAAQCISLLAGLGAVAMTYLLALRIAGAVLPDRWAAWTAALAAALLALSGLQIQADGTIMADAPALWWATAAIWLWTAPWAIGDRWRSRLVSFAAGLCFALAISTRFEYAPLAVALALYWLVLRIDGAAPSAPAWLLGAVLTAIPQALYTLQYSDPVLHQQWLTTWSPVHIWQSQFATQDGVQHYSMSAGVFYLLHPLYSPQSLPFTLAPFLLVGIATLWLGRRSADGGCSVAPAARAFVLLLLAWWLVPALYLAGVPFESARFALVYAPPLAMLEAVGLAVALFTLSLRWRGAVRAGILLAVLSLCLLVADARRPLAALSDGKAGDLAAVHWLTTHAPHGATLVTFSLTLTLYHNGNLQAHQWKLVDLSAISPPAMIQLAHTSHLVVISNEANLAQQWPDLAPERSLRWLLDYARLRQVAYVGGYTIRER